MYHKTSQLARTKAKQIPTIKRRNCRYVNQAIRCNLPSETSWRRIRRSWASPGRRRQDLSPKVSLPVGRYNQVHVCTAQLENDVCTVPWYQVLESDDLTRRTGEDCSGTGSLRIFIPLVSIIPFRFLCVRKVPVCCLTSSSFFSGSTRTYKASASLTWTFVSLPICSSIFYNENGASSSPYHGNLCGCFHPGAKLLCVQGWLCCAKPKFATGPSGHSSTC